MKTPRTLRTRIAFYFCGYLAILLTVYSGALVFVLKASEDLAFNRQLAEIADRLAQHVEDYGKIPGSLPMHISAHLGLPDVPLRFRNYLTNRVPGVFEIDEERFDYHVAIVALPSSGQMLYVLYDVASIETTDRFESYMALALLAIGLGVLAMGWLLARSLSNRILNPVSELAGAVQSLPIDQEAAELRAFTASDEVGALAKTIDQLLRRIAAFTRREREFTSHTSHELRTPVTVIRGAVEIIKKKRCTTDETIQRPLQRIERAVKDIEMLIETFLLLARQDQLPDENEACSLSEVVDKVVASYGYLLEGRSVEIRVRSTDAGTVPAPASLVAIALGNLVRNAFQYTLQGEVEIRAFTDRVRVTDSGPGFDNSRPGSGLGLTIVERLCERMHWGVTVDSRPGKGTRAELVFSTDGSAG